MTPGSPRSNAADSCSGNSVLSSKLLVRYPRSRVSLLLSDFKDAPICAFGVVRLFSGEGRKTPRFSSFGNGIMMIIGIRSQEEMQGADAAGVVAVMTDADSRMSGSRGNLAKGDCPGHAVGVQLQAFRVRHSKHSVATGSFGSSPLPASVSGSFAHLAPKAFDDSRGEAGKNRFVHDDLLVRSLCSLGGSYNSLRAPTRIAGRGGRVKRALHLNQAR